MMEEPEVETRQQLWGNHKAKAAEVSNTSIMPPTAGGRPARPQLAIKKTGSALEEFLEKGANVVAARAALGKRDEGKKKTGSVNPRVDVSGLEAPAVVVEKHAQHLALPSQGLYPLDSYLQVKQASAYFEEWSGHMEPAHRHEYCGNLVKRAGVLGIEVSDEVHKYGSSTYAAPGEVDICLDARRTALGWDDEHQGLLDKLAGVRLTTHPEVFAGALHEFDKMAGLDAHYDGGGVPDPWYSTFGKKAEESDDKSWVIGNDTIYAKNLKQLATTGCAVLKNAFGEDFVKEFKADPIGIFSSMPDDQKKIIGRFSEPSENP